MVNNIFNEDLKLKALAGIPIVENIGKIYPLKLNDIANMGEDQYNQHLSYLCFDKTIINNLDISNEDLKTLNEELKNITEYQFLFTYLYKDIFFREKYLESLSIFFKEKINFHESGFLFLGNMEDNRFIDSNNFDKIINIIKIINNIKAKEGYNPANEQARKLIEKIEKKNAIYAKLNKKNAINLFTIISSIAWKSNIGIDAVWDLTIFQLYDAYSRIALIDNYDKTMQGIYAGTVDVKKINIKDVSWIKYINN